MHKSEERTAATPTTKLRVLLVDDNEEDVELVSIAIAESKDFRTTITAARDGVAALEALDAVPDERLPDFILLDVKMPRMDGRELLRELRQRERYASLPVLMFSTSESPLDVAHCYREGCNAYFVKPLGYTELVEIIDEILRHWGRRVRLPHATS
ncbi:MAG: response regulator [Planctomycetota bacterium]